MYLLSTNGCEPRQFMLPPDEYGDIDISSIQLENYISDTIDNVYSPQTLEDELGEGCTFHDAELAQSLNERVELGMMMSNLGATHVSDHDTDNMFTSSSLYADNPKGVSKDFLSKIWMITEEQAANTLAHTT